MSNWRATTNPKNSVRSLLQTTGQRGETAPFASSPNPPFHHADRSVRSKVTADGPGLATPTLLDLDLATLLFQGSLDLLSLGLGHAFLDGLGGAVD